MRINQSVKTKILLVLAILIFGIFGLYAINITPSLVSVDNIEFYNYEDGVLEGKLELSFQNKSLIRGKIHNIDYKLFYHDIKIANGYSEKPLTLKTGVNQNFKGIFALNLSSIEKEIKTLLLMDSIELLVVTTGKYGLFRIPFKKILYQHVSCKQLVTALCKSTLSKKGIKLESVELESFSLDKSLFTLKTNFTNTLPLDITINSYSFQILSDPNNKNPIGSFEKNDETTVKVGEHKSLYSSVQCNNYRAGFSGITKVISGTLDYYIKGILSVSFDEYDINIPIENRFEFKPQTGQIIVVN